MLLLIFSIVIIAIASLVAQYTNTIIDISEKKKQTKSQFIESLIPFGWILHSYRYMKDYYRSLK